MPFNIKQKVLFKHCDPAGIVFYPRYFEIMNDTVEIFFSDYLETPFELLHEYGGTPAVDIHTQFHAVSRHGDMLDIALKPTRIGGASLELLITVTCADEKRLTTKITLVHVDKEGRSTAWSNEIRNKVNHLLESEEVFLSKPNDYR